MSDSPAFSNTSYQIERELGHNRAGGRVTYLAKDTRTQKNVVIKQFQFAKTGASWAEYDAYDREIQFLKQLDHPGIPHYIDSFQTPNGFCMVQEYKHATSLSENRSFNPEDIRRIAIAALEILVYLQNRIPAVIHRDIKPENILLDANGAVYLVDFGFARVGGEDVGVSSVVKGTLGFMPPEQLFNRQLTEASDLYGLGMTLICLLTGTKSDRIGDLVDISYRVSFKHLVPSLNLKWVNWLEKMVEPRLKERFPNALAALAATPTSPLRPPDAQFSQATLKFHAACPGDRLTQVVMLTNPIPETLLEGKWEIAPHPHDPPTAHYCWLSVTPDAFADNQVECQVTVDTRKLMAGKTYHRKLLLHTNTLAKTYSLNLQIQTAAAPAKFSHLPKGLLLLLGAATLIVNWLVASVVLSMGTVEKSVSMAGFGAVVGTAIGLEFAAWLMRSAGGRTGSTTCTLAALGVGAVALIEALASDLTAAGAVVILSAGAGAMNGAVTGVMAGMTVEKLMVGDNPKAIAITTVLLIATVGSSIGLGFAIGFMNLAILTVLLSSSLALGTLVSHLYLKRANMLFSHRKTERYLIKP
ncbi:MAG: protein kinase [Stenomitos rutilans HA7619-LM2]|jgi:serine/threonine protein kinase|nr:protein kinase [Stenomitos rutilans HA7619-LM2]